jgi:transcriptional regulator NrdR family protein
MKCPLCGAETVVVRSERRVEARVNRIRECFNEHRFDTLEQATTAPRDKHKRRGRPRKNP